MTSRSTGLSILVCIVAAAAVWALYINTHSLQAPMDTADATTSVSSVGTSTDSEFPAAAGADTEYASDDTVMVTAHLGEAAQALGETITPTAVIDDSRCPTDVQCIWAGTVHVKATVDGGMGKAALTLELGKESTTEVNSIILQSVAPSKNSKQQIAPEDYIFTFKVTRR